MRIGPFSCRTPSAGLRGKHQLKFGGDFRFVRNDFDFDFYNNGGFDFSLYIGTLTGDPLADFVGGFPDNYYQFSNAKYGIRTQSYYFFAQDTYGHSAVLTQLRFALRIQHPARRPAQQHHRLLSRQRNPLSFPTHHPTLLYPGDPGTPNRVWSTPTAITLRPVLPLPTMRLGNGKLIFRGGFGIFYDIEDGALNLQFGGQPPFGAVENINPTPTSYSSGGRYQRGDRSVYPIRLNQPLPTNDKIVGFGVPKIPFAYVVYPHFRTPYSENINLGYQYQLTPSTMLEMDYVSTLGRKSISSYDLNHPDESLLEGQYAAYGSTYADCARPLAVCYDPAFPDQTPPRPPWTPTLRPRKPLQLLTDLSNGSSTNHELQVTVDHQLARD